MVGPREGMSKSALPREIDSRLLWAILSDAHFLVPATVFVAGVLLLVALS